MAPSRRCCCACGIHEGPCKFASHKSLGEKLTHGMQLRGVSMVSGLRISILGFESLASKLLPSIHATL
jgi:hypothetical protein